MEDLPQPPSPHIVMEILFAGSIAFAFQVSQCLSDVGMRFAS